ncbi:hypothetical protein [Burkholderia cepacia]|nr:hypothetical protein [Burkholderia cepacia]
MSRIWTRGCDEKLFFLITMIFFAVEHSMIWIGSKDCPFQSQ